jgi:hypothetical protein
MKNEQLAIVDDALAQAKLLHAPDDQYFVNYASIWLEDVRAKMVKEFKKMEKEGLKIE